MQRVRNPNKEYDVSTISSTRNAYTCATYIAHPHLGIPEDLVTGKRCIPEVQQVLANNKALFRSFIQYDSDSASSSSRKKEVISYLISKCKEVSYYYDSYKILKKELLDAIKLLNSHGVQTLFLKSSKILPLDSDNFDILIHTYEMKDADQLLKRNGFSVVKSADEPYKVLYRKTRNGKDYLALHLHTKIAWYGVEFLKTEEVWKKYLVKSIEGTNVGFISPEHHVLVTVAHAFFENASLKLGDIMYLVDSFSDNELDLGMMVSSSMGMGWDVVFCTMLLFGNSVHRDVYGLPILPKNKLSSVFLEALSKEKINKIKYLYKKMKIFYQKPYLPISIRLRNYRRRQLLSQVIFNSSLSLTDKSEKLGYLFSVFLRGAVPIWRQKPSITVSFVGADGTGKTTHARRLVDNFKRRGYLGAYIWSKGSFHFSKPFMSLATSLLVSSSSTKSYEELSNIRGERVRTNRLFGKMLTVLLVFEHLIQIRSKLFLRRLSNNAVIFDRYLHDTIVDSLLYYGQGYDSFFSKSLLSLVDWFVPRPDLIILLRSNPQTISRRRPEENPEAIGLKSRIYELWSRRWGACVLDTEQGTIEQNHSRLLEKALKLFYEGKNKEASQELKSCGQVNL